MEENQNLQETLDQAQDVVENQEVAQAESSAEINMRELREHKKRLERERDELRNRMEQIEASQKQSASSEKPSLADDDLVEWKYVKQEIEALKNQISSYQQTSTAANAEARLKAKYTDFDQVVNADNIEKLRTQYPEIAATLSTNQDLYTQASAAYDIIKRYGIYQDNRFDAEKKRVQENASKPRPMNTASGQKSNSPLDQANAFADGLTPELKKQLWEEMNRASKLR